MVAGLWPSRGTFGTHGQPRTVQLPGLEKAAHLIVIGERKDVEAVSAVLKKEAERKLRTALEGPGAELADSDPAVDVRLAKHLPQLMQCEQALGPLGASERFQPLKDGGGD